LIRVASKQQAYWCIDNRRLFVYKHCQLGEIPVKVYQWRDNKEFELKFRNGLSTRAMTAEGRRVGLMQRMERPLPISPAAEPSISQINVYMTEEQQARHDAKIAALRTNREQQAKLESLAEKEAVCDAQKAALCKLLVAPTTGGAAKQEAEPSGSAKKVKRKKKGVAKALAGGSLESTLAAGNDEAAANGAGCHSEDAFAGELAPTRQQRKNKKRKVTAGQEDAVDAAALDDGTVAVPPKKKKKRLKAAARSTKQQAESEEGSEDDDEKLEAGAQSTPPAKATTSGPQGAAAGQQQQAKLTVALGAEDSDDDAYDVELTLG